MRRLVTILRREAAAGVSAALLHFANAVARPGGNTAGRKEPRNLSYRRDQAAATITFRTGLREPPAGPQGCFYLSGITVVEKTRTLQKENYCFQGQAGEQK